MDSTQCTTDDIMNTIVLVLSFPAKRYPYCRKKLSRFSRMGILENLKIIHKCHLAALINSERTNLLKRKVILLHDNATPHSTKLNQSLPNQLKWYVFHHLASSANLAPSDHVIQGQQCNLASRYFAMEEDLQSMAAVFFAKLDAEWYTTGIYKLILCYNKCVDEQVIM